MELAWGAVTGAWVVMFLFALIFLGLLALIPVLRNPYGLRHTLAWLLGSLLYGWLVQFYAPVALSLASLLCGAAMAVRCWWMTRQSTKAA